MQAEIKACSGQALACSMTSCLLFLLAHACSGWLGALSLYRLCKPLMIGYVMHAQGRSTAASTPLSRCASRGGGMWWQSCGREGWGTAYWSY